jgi:hypothetical protein
MARESDIHAAFTGAITKDGRGRHCHHCGIPEAPG